MNNSKYCKNGKIECMRFVFAMAVVLYHGQKHFMDIDSSGICVAFFKRGYIGVEFFFLLTGFFMAKHVYTKALNTDICNGVSWEKNNLGLETVQFIWKKIKGILPYHFVAFALLFIFRIIAERWNGATIVAKFVGMIPNLFLFDKVGFNFYSLNRVEWYISCMIFSMMILYPLCRRYYSMFVHVIAPTGGFFLLGYLCENYGTFTNVNRWNGIVFICMIRAIAEISLGATAFEISRVLSRKKFSSETRRWLTVFEWCGYILIVAYMMSTASKKYEIYVLLLMVMCISLGFSEQVYGAKIFQNKVCMFLGQISLPIYLSQVLALDCVKIYLTHYGSGIKIMMVVFITFINTGVCVGVVQLLKKLKYKYSR